VNHPLAQHSVGFAATAGTTEEHFEHRTFEQRPLGEIPTWAPDRFDLVS